jgi:hypothetical protein
MDKNYEEVIRIRELNPEIIPPISAIPGEEKYGGSKIVVIGKPGTGKSTLIKSFLYSKKHIFPVGIAFSGTESENHFYESFMPSTFIFSQYDDAQLESFLKRQKLACEHLENPWAFVSVDDCVDDASTLRSKIQLATYKKGRHWKLMYILALQYAMDILPGIRGSVDATFILRESNLTVRKTLYENYGGNIPDFKLFCQLMDKLTDDNCALVIVNCLKTTNWQDCVFWYKAKPVPPDFKIGCQEYWDFHHDRYNPEYKEPIL